VWESVSLGAMVREKKEICAAGAAYRSRGAGDTELPALLEGPTGHAELRKTYWERAWVTWSCGRRAGDAHGSRAYMVRRTSVRSEVN
jgi:hypothetical protein